MRPYLINDVTGSFYYHHSETKMADSSEDELSDSSGNLSVVSDEDFEVSGSSEDSIREDELRNEHGSAVSRPCLSEDRNFTWPRWELLAPTYGLLVSQISENDEEA